MVREFRDVLEKGYTGSNGVRCAPDWGKTIVFAVTKRHAETLARMFDDVFADKKPSPTTRYADFVVSGLGPDDSVDGPAKIKRFKKEEFPQILVSVNMLDTGFDCPDVRNLVMARFTHSSILYQQMRGRGTRLSPGKDRFTMWDFTGVTLRHGDDESPGKGGVVVVRPAIKPEGQPRRMLTLDLHDEIDPATREWVTVDETGHAFLDVDEAKAEALGAAFETWLNGQVFNSDQLRLLPPRAGIARRLGAHPARLARLAPQKPVQKLSRRGHHPLLAEQRTYPRLYIPQRRGPKFQRRLNRSSCHP